MLGEQALPGGAWGVTGAGALLAHCCLEVDIVDLIVESHCRISGFLLILTLAFSQVAHTIP